MLSEFKDFINRGNVVELAVGLVLGAAFGTVVASFVGDLLMPIVGMFMGGKDFSTMYVNLSGQTFESYAAAKEAGAAVLGYGQFINVVITFLFTAFAVFLVAKVYNNMKKKEEAAPAPTPANEVLLSEIRDLLKK